MATNIDRFKANDTMYLCKGCPAKCSPVETNVFGTESGAGKLKATGMCRKGESVDVDKAKVDA
jgi:hypothetical protein